jgi:putative ABC transport system permease protein
VKTLDRKLVREIGRLRGQVITICLVVAAGIAAYIAMQTAYLSLHYSQDSYYEAYRFPDVFASARRAPDSVGERIREIPGVSLVYTKTVESVRIPLGEGEKVVSGNIVSLPDHGQPPLNNVYLRKGRMPETNQADEALLLEIFAKAKGINPGDRLPIIVDGRKREVLITGIALSPEYVFAIGGDVFAYEPGSFAVLWMRKSAINPAFNMEGAFNDVTLTLQPGASEQNVIAALDEILDPYGSFGAYGRDKQISNHFLKSELDGLKVMAIFIPIIFLAVAAFLVNVVLGRLVQLQRGQIATLKALGYSNLAVGMHFLKLVSLIVLLGSAIGIGAGAWLGDGMLAMYEPFFSFPEFKNQFDFSVIAIAVFISLVSAVGGAILSVRNIVAMTPAEAMRPPSPPAFKMGFWDRVTKHTLGAVGRMVVRELTRQPLRLLVSSLGIAMAVAILVLGRFAYDSMDQMMDLVYRQSMKEDLAVNFLDPLPAKVENSLRSLPGVHYVESIRSVPVKFRAGAVTKDSSIQATRPNSRLRTIIDRDGKIVEPPLGGMLLTDVLADQLGVKAGDIIEVTILEDNRPKKNILIAGTVSDMLGMQGYMRYDTLKTLLGEERSVTMALLSVDPQWIRETERRLEDMPTVGGVMRPETAMENFDKQQGGTMTTMTFVLAFFASIIAIGIVYNNARVSLSMRSRDLASMRVLGFTRGEIFGVLLGELSVQILLAIPIGMWLGITGSEALMSMDPENYRMPAVISGKTYIFSIGITVAASIASGLLVRRKLNKLDLIEVLKTRE